MYLVNNIIRVRFITKPIVTGVVDLTLYVTKPDGTSLSPILMNEIAAGIYEGIFNPNTIGFWDALVSSSSQTTLRDVRSYYIETGNSFSVIMDSQLEMDINGALQAKNVTKDLVPRGDGQGNIGSQIKQWIQGFFYQIYTGAITNGNVNATVADIVDAVNKKHSPHSDDQDLSGLVTKTTAVNSKPLSSSITLTTGDIADSTDKRYCTDTQKTVIGNTSNVNTGDETNTTIKNKLGITVLSGQNTGDETNGTLLSKLGIPSISGTNSGDQDLSNLNPKRLFYNLPSVVSTSGTVETKLFNLLIPANSAVIGSTYRIRMIGNSSGTGTLTFRVRVGANGTISDNQVWISTTSAAQVANARAGIDVLVTTRSTTSAFADGVAHAGAVVLPTLIASPATAAINTGSNWYIDISCTCSSGTFSAQVGVAEEIK